MNIRDMRRAPTLPDEYFALRAAFDAEFKSVTGSWSRMGLVVPNYSQAVTLPPAQLVVDGATCGGLSSQALS